MLDDDIIWTTNYDDVLTKAFDQTALNEAWSNLKEFKIVRDIVDEHVDCLCSAQIHAIKAADIEEFWVTTQASISKFLADFEAKQTLSPIEKFVAKFSRSNNFRLRKLAQQLSNILQRYHEHKLDTYILQAALLLDQFNTTITQQYKAAKATLLLLLKKVRPFRSIDRRRTFRRIIKILFKNMDDRSGYANDEATCRCFAHFIHLINRQQYVQQNTAVISPG